MNVFVKKQVGYQAMRKRLKAKDRAIEVTYLYASHFFSMNWTKSQFYYTDCNTILLFSFY